MSVKQARIRSECIRAVPRDGTPKFGLAHGFDDHIDVAAEPLIQQTLPSAQVEQVKPSASCRGDDDVNITSGKTLASGHGAEQRGMGDATHLQGRA